MAMNLIFHELLGIIVEVYINDIVVKSASLDSHLADLRLAFEKICQYCDRTPSGRGSSTRLSLSDSRRSDNTINTHKYNTIY
jgi:hypothetical protein